MGARVFGDATPIVLNRISLVVPVPPDRAQMLTTEGFHGATVGQSFRNPLSSCRHRCVGLTQANHRDQLQQ
jgi:hypothetical protein